LGLADDSCSGSGGRQNTYRIHGKHCDSVWKHGRGRKNESGMAFIIYQALRP